MAFNWFCCSGDRSSSFHSHPSPGGLYHWHSFSLGLDLSLYNHEIYGLYGKPNYLLYSQCLIMDGKLGNSQKTTNQKRIEVKTAHNSHQLKLSSSNRLGIKGTKALLYSEWNE